jgi:hypothetical protein
MINAGCLGLLSTFRTSFSYMSTRLLPWILSSKPSFCWGMRAGLGCWVAALALPCRARLCALTKCENAGAPPNARSFKTPRRYIRALSAAALPGGTPRTTNQPVQRVALGVCLWCGVWWWCGGVWRVVGAACWQRRRSHGPAPAWGTSGPPQHLLLSASVPRTSSSMLSSRHM